LELNAVGVRRFVYADEDSLDMHGTLALSQREREKI